MHLFKSPFLSSNKILWFPLCRLCIFLLLLSDLLRYNLYAIEVIMITDVGCHANTTMTMTRNIIIIHKVPPVSLHTLWLLTTADLLLSL